ncbi:hypothetical protein TNCV_3729761 [Trichonephila clavipes]|nr:hypothetical protein TNCV_3729761 [Trichonephila clavipes]
MSVVGVIEHVSNLPLVHIQGTEVASGGQNPQPMDPNSSNMTTR